MFEIKYGFEFIIGKKHILSPQSVIIEYSLTDIIAKYHKLFERISNNTLIDGDIELIKSLPNFDAKIFLEITGIDLTEDE